MAHSWINAVYDRTAADLVYGNSKGNLSYTDLNRIENNIEHLLEKYVANNIPCSISPGGHERNWTRSSYLRLSMFNTIKQEIMAIRATGYIRTNTPTLKNSVYGDSYSFQEINDMEKILADAKMIIDAVEAIKKSQRVLGAFTLSQYDTNQKIRHT